MNSRSNDSAAWARAREVFLDLADLAPDERDAELAALQDEDPELAGWVRRLLAQDARSAADESGERRFGAYETTRRIASGGMGDVFLARRVDGEFEREVAVKLLRCSFRGDEVVQRFQRERQTLATLDHEYVARLLDGGTTEEGEPYLVMEYVEGTRLDDYCHDNNLALRERIELFVRVLAAVQHAHERGVIHRDLKPSNILVRDDGSPRLLDFGIARPRDEDATPGGALTLTGHRLFTPEYASPEQIRGDEITVATDVFALGVLLHELLTGRRLWPAGLSLHELELQILDVPSPPPSRHRSGTARRALTGDLDTITLKCLEKEPARRYGSVAELAGDLERHLQGRPIRARRTSMPGRAWRYARRKPWTCAAGVGLVAALVATGAALRSASQNRERRVELVAAIGYQIDSADNLRDGARLEDARAELDAALLASEAVPEETLLRARILGQLAVTSNHQRNWPEAVEFASESLALLSPDDLDATRLRVSALNAKSHALFWRGEKRDAWGFARESLDLARERLPAGDEVRVDALLEVADQLADRGEVEAAMEHQSIAADELRAAHDPRHPGLGAVLNALGLALAQADRHVEAIETLEEARAIFGWHFGEGHPNTATLRNNLGESYRILGQLDAAEEQFEHALATYEEIEGVFGIAMTNKHIGELARDRREWSRALDHLLASQDAFREYVGPHHPALQMIERLRADVLALSGDFLAARTAYETALHGEHGVAAYGDAEEAIARAGLGRVLLELDEVELGRAELERALELREVALGPDHPDTLAVRALLEGE